MLTFRDPSNRGNTLISALVALMVIGIAAKTLMQLHDSSTRSLKSTRIRLDLQDVKKTISARLSCQKTLAAYGPPPITCTGDVTLLDGKNKNIISPSGKLANWAITARCENLGGQDGLSIYATKKLPSGAYMKDPLNDNLILDESSPVSLVFKPDVRPCADFFDPNAGKQDNCSSNQYMIGIETSADGSTKPVCKDVPECKNNETLTLKDGTLQCVSGSTGHEIVNGTAEFPPVSIPCGWDTTMRHVVGQVCCPPGKIAVNGGGSCNEGKGGFMEASKPQSNNCWFVNCCKYSPYDPSAIFVGCVNP